MNDQERKLLAADSANINAAAADLVTCIDSLALSARVVNLCESASFQPETEEAALFKGVDLELLGSVVALLERTIFVGSRA